LTLADYTKMNAVRARVDTIVQDKATADALKPWYRQFCKRPCFHDEYLPTYNRPNVHLIDTAGRGVERLTERGVVVNGQEIELDCLIFATGFEVGTSFTRRAGYEITGRNGVTLSSYWKDGIRTLHGLTTDGFPNCFFVGRTQAAVTVNLPLSLENQTRHVMHMLQEARAQGAKTLEPAPEAVADYVSEIRRLNVNGSEFYVECTPGYYNSEGAVGNKNGFFSETYGAGSLKFFEILAQWRAEGLPGVMLR
jgi:cation diffusion facilitator CzcD-associated flavoprotein CzcO